MEFEASKNEISRRKKAFVTLLVSVIVGLFLASKIFFYPISALGYSLITGIFLLVGILTFKFLNVILKVRIRISDEKIERINLRTREIFNFSGISRIKIKRRTNGVIREMYLWFNDKSLFLTALEENFEKISEIVKSKVGENVVIKEMYEPVDFDHPLFYSLLGLPISFFSIYLITFISGASSFQVTIIMFVFSVFMLLFGAYFIFKKPIVARYQGKRVGADYFFGIFMLCAGVFMLLVGLSC